MYGDSKTLLLSDCELSLHYSSSPFPRCARLHWVLPWHPFTSSPTSVDRVLVRTANSSPGHLWHRTVMASSLLDSNNFALLSWEWTKPRLKSIAHLWPSSKTFINLSISVFCSPCLGETSKSTKRGIGILTFRCQTLVLRASAVAAAQGSACACSHPWLLDPFFDKDILRRHLSIHICYQFDAADLIQLSSYDMASVSFS